MRRRQQQTRIKSERRILSWVYTKTNCKYFGGKMRCEDNYVMVKRATTKQVTLLDGRSLTARYARVSTDTLPSNGTIQRRYKQRAAPKNRRR